LPLYTDDTRLDDVVDTINNNSGKWSSVDDSNFPNIEPPVPTNVQASGAFRSIIVEWDFDRATYIANYEVFASEVKGFTPDTSNLVFRGKTSVYSYEADVNEQWYFRVRAVNTHGTPNEFSEEVSATTARIISDDILFGEEIAAELRELSKKAEILAGDSIGIDKLKQEALDVINETAKQYTDEEIRETEEEIHEELAKKAGLNYVEGEFTLVDSDLADLLDEMEDLQEYASSIDQKADSISLDVSAIAKTVDDNTESILIVGSSIT
ncbi:fibronectin type III domain-containing protein, partial [Jeotgalibacillus marinus]